MSPLFKVIALYGIMAHVQWELSSEDFILVRENIELDFTCLCYDQGNW